MNAYLLVLVIYSAVLIGLGAFVSRSVKKAADFFIAGRDLGSGLLFSTLLAANIGAGSTVGAAGLGYEFGLSGWWWVGSAGIGSLILAFTVGPKIWKVAAQSNLYTVGDYLEKRYSRRVRGVIAGLLWIGTLAILAGQLIALAWILNVVAGVSKPLGCLLGGAVIIIYFAAGGLLSAAWVNVLQVMIKMSGFLLALPIVFSGVGGWEAMKPPAGGGRFEGSFFSVTGIGLKGIVTYITLLAPSFIVSPGLLQKVYGAKDVRSVKIGVGLNAAALLLFAFVPVLMGMAAASLYPELGNRELALPTVIVSLLPFWLGALALAAVFSAEVSTADAILFMLATSLSKDLYQSFLRPHASDQQLLRVSRIAAIGSGALGMLIAIMLPSVIAALSIFYGLLSIALFMPLILGLYSSRPTAATALAAILTSVPAAAAIHLLTEGEGVSILSPVAIGILISLFIMLAHGLAARLTRREIPPLVRS
ncbi:MAG: sodium:solute symporter family protein [candidate division WOR-3 bacterium]